jgi:hypothetical protein
MHLPIRSRGARGIDFPSCFVSSGTYLSVCQIEHIMFDIRVENRFRAAMNANRSYTLALCNIREKGRISIRPTDLFGPFPERNCQSFREPAIKFHSTNRRKRYILSVHADAARGRPRGGCGNSMSESDFLTFVLVCRCQRVGYPLHMAGFHPKKFGQVILHRYGANVQSLCNRSR